MEQVQLHALNVSETGTAATVECDDYGLHRWGGVVPAHAYSYSATVHLAQHGPCCLIAPSDHGLLLNSSLMVIMSHEWSWMAKVLFHVWGSDGLGCGVNKLFCEIVTKCDSARCTCPSPHAVGVHPACRTTPALVTHDCALMWTDMTVVLKQLPIETGVWHLSVHAVLFKLSSLAILLCLVMPVPTPTPKVPGQGWHHTRVCISLLPLSCKFHPTLND